MKNRILSFVLALVMVLALVPVAAIGASAEVAKEATISAGHVTVAPGEKAYVPVYVELSTATGFDGIYFTQIDFELSEGATLTSNCTWYPTAGAASGFVNVENNTIGASANSGVVGLLAVTEQLTAKGGVIVALMEVAVDAGVAEGTVLTVNPVKLTELTIRDYDGEGNIAADEKANETYNVSLVAGSITVVGYEEGAADANEDEVDFYAIPEFNAAGEKVTSIIRNNPQEGVYGTLYVPSAITSVAKRSFGAEITNALIFKNTDAFDGYDIIADCVADDATIYYHRLANGTDTMYEDLAANYGEDYAIANILGGGATVDGNDLTVFGTIRVEDLAYENVTVEVVINGRTFEADFNCVYTTLTHNGKAVVSTNSEAVANGAADGEGVYVFGLTITGVDAGTYDVVVNVYGTTAASNGSPVVVRNDSTVITVTV